MVERICLLGLPRTGSNYVAGLIANSHEDSTDLGEPFTEDFPMTIELDHENRASIVERSLELTTEENVNDCLTKLRATDPNQNLVIKVFYYTYLKDHFSLILEEIKKLGFKFLVVKRRDVEGQLISYGVALSTQRWVDRIDDHRPPITDKIKIENFDNMQWLHQRVLNFTKGINKYDIDYEEVYYEEAVAGLTKYLGRPVTEECAKIKKQAPADPYEQLSNASVTKLLVKYFLQTNQRPQYEITQYHQ